MLTEKEKIGCREILSKLEVADLLTLTDTVSNRSVSVENRNEALDAILLYSSNPLQLLRRKKVKREHLYSYLAENQHVAAPTADKATLIRKTLELWGTQCTNFNEQQNAIPDRLNNEENDGFGGSNGAKTVENEITDHSDTAMTKLDCGLLAQHFINWYYKVINSLVTPSVEKPSEWGPQHFWSDSNLKLFMSSGNSSYDECQGSLAVSEKLYELVQKERILFNPFVEGVKGQLNAYGLVLVSIGGTVHRYSQCIGVFEQSFGLIKDPNMDNNWKIKFTELKMKASGGNEIESQNIPAIGSV